MSIRVLDKSTGQVIEYADGTPPEQISKDMKLRSIDRSLNPPGPPDPGSLFHTPTLGDRAAALLPAAGGLAGDLVGGAVGGIPGAVLGGGIGGGAGEAAKQLLTRKPITAGGVAGAAAGQAATSAIGGGLAAGARAAAPGLMRAAMRPTDSLLRRFPTVISDTMERGIGLGAGGSAKAAALRGAAKGNLQNALDTALASGKTFQAGDIAAPVRQELLSSKVMPEEAKAAIAKRLEAFMAQHGGGPLDPQVVQAMKRLYQQTARPVYNAAQQQEGIPVEALGREALFASRIAKGARQQLETIPGVADANKELQALKGVGIGVRKAQNRPPMPLQLHVPASWPLLGLNSKTAMATYARWLNSPTFQGIARHSPRLAAALIYETSLSAEPDATGGGQ